MTLEELIRHYNAWAKSCRLTAQSMGFDDSEFVPWVRQNAPTTMSILCAQIELGDENPVQAVNMFLVKGWDPKLPTDFVPPDGGTEVPFEPEDPGDGQ